MGEFVGIAITLGTIGGYLYLNWFVASRSASFISNLFAKPDDDEVVGHDIDEETGLPSIPVTRSGRRFSLLCPSSCTSTTSTSQRSGACSMPSATHSQALHSNSFRQSNSFRG